jgi:hypothetical protein
VSLDGILSAEGAGVPGVLGDFHLLDLLSEGGTVSERERMSLGFNSLYVGGSSRPQGIQTAVVERAYLVPYLPVTPTSERH